MTPTNDPAPAVATQTNAAMDALLGSHPGAAEIFVPSPFRLLVLGGFKNIGGCVLFREFFHADGVNETILERYQDRTGVECTVNKLHLEDYLEKGMAREAPSLALTAMRCAEFLAERLTLTFPKEPFRVIVSVEDRICTLRFHQVRKGETWFEDITVFEEALFQMDVSVSATGWA